MADVPADLQLDFDRFLSQNVDAELLRFTTAGSVDDGKSTLIGRLLYDSKSIFEDHLESVESASRRLNREEVDLALLMDGLRSEREQGITIDVAYRYFSTPRRRFIIADTPGHVQYTRNMVTGASTANLAVVLIDARQGVLTQSKRHGFIASLLGIPHVAVCVNKMDLVDFSQEVFEQIREDYQQFASRLEVPDIQFFPISALKGDNVVNRSERTPWYEGPPLLAHLETVYIGGDRNLVDFRFPVQYVSRPNLDFRGYAGTVCSGVVRVGDEVRVLPSGKRSRVKSIVTYDGEIDYAFPPLSVTICLEDEIDISRGDMLVHPGNLPDVEQEVEAMVVWMADAPFRLGAPYVIKHTTRTVRGEFTDLPYRINMDTLHREETETLELNDIGRTVLRLYRPILSDEYARNRATGAFIVIDPMTNATVGAGMIIQRSRHSRGIHPSLRQREPEAPVSRNITHQRGAVSLEQRARMLGQKPALLWLTGLSGSGKSTIGFALEKRLADMGKSVYVLDGDNVRHGLNSDLGFSPEDRAENIRRVAEVGQLFNDAGLIAITSFISPYRSDRSRAREIVGEGRFVEIFVDTPLEVCEERDPRGLYQKARAGEITEFTGVSAPYEAPADPEIHLTTTDRDVDACVDVIVDWLRDGGYLA
jgi:bifunctional enzyme CysN/CysC